MNTPTLKRRLASMLYESLLLFGVVFIADAALDVLTQSRHALKLRELRMLWLFLVIGAYFLFFWCRSGQTLAMKTWRIRVVSADGTPLRAAKAALRYVLAWFWFLPALAIDYFLGLKGWPSMVVLAGGMLAWLSTARFDRDGQFLHDRLAGTRLAEAPPVILVPV